MTFSSRVIYILISMAYLKCLISHRESKEERRCCKSDFTLVR
jgi:uncharacterized membrane protein YuzA (DUF378 family)